MYPAILWCVSCERQGPVTGAGVGGERAHHCLIGAAAGKRNPCPSQGIWGVRASMLPGHDVPGQRVCGGKGCSAACSPCGVSRSGSSGEVAGKPRGAYAASCEVALFSFSLLLPQHLCWGEKKYISDLKLQGCYLPSGFSCICRRLAPAFCTSGVR